VDAVVRAVLAVSTTLRTLPELHGLFASGRRSVRHRRRQLHAPGRRRRLLALRSQHGVLCRGYRAVHHPARAGSGAAAQFQDQGEGFLPVRLFLSVDHGPGRRRADLDFAIRPRWYPLSDGYSHRPHAARARISVPYRHRTAEHHAHGHLGSHRLLHAALPGGPAGVAAAVFRVGYADERLQVADAALRHLAGPQADDPSGAGAQYDQVVPGIRGSLCNDQRRTTGIHRDDGVLRL